MTPTQAKRTAVAAFIVAGIIAVLREQRFDRLGRTLVGIMAGAVMLSMLADWQPELAGSFAALLLVAALLGTARNEGATPLLRLVKIYDNPTERPGA